jgi:aryl-alcohol dehydrogenase-like predicted oxidoreductase
MLLNLSVERVIQLIGHDGSEIWYPNEPEPHRRRGFTTQEFMDVAFHEGYAMMEILQPEAWDGENLNTRRFIDSFPFARNFEERILFYMTFAQGLVTGHYSANSYHMAAWDNTTRQIFDPSHRGVYSFDTNAESIVVESFLPIFRIKS